MKQYTQAQDWIEYISDTHVRVGLSVKAIQEVGPIVWIDLPQKGAKLQSGDVAVVVESTKAAVDIVAPLGGTVTKRNEALLVEEGVALLNEDPENSGWLYEIEHALSL